MFCVLLMFFSRILSSYSGDSSNDAGFEPGNKSKWGSLRFLSPVVLWSQQVLLV